MAEVFIRLRPGDIVYFDGKQWFIIGMFLQTIAHDDNHVSAEWFCILRPLEFASVLTIPMHFYAPAIKVLPSLLNNQNDGSEWDYLESDEVS